MTKKFLIIIVLFLASIVSVGAGVVYSGWFSSVIESGVNKGKLWLFNTSNTNNNNNPVMILWTGSVEVNWNIKITGWTPSFKKVLTAIDNDWNTSWEYPSTGINFTEIEGFRTNINKWINYTGFKIDFPDYWVYSITLQAILMLPNQWNLIIWENERIPIIQFLPSKNIGENDKLWWAKSPRFSGSYEVYWVPTQYNDRIKKDRFYDYRFYLSENIVIDETTWKTAYLFLQSPLNWEFFIWKNANPNCPQCTGGSYTRIK